MCFYSRTSGKIPDPLEKVDETFNKNLTVLD